MKDGNKKKSEQLGMSHGTAANRLRKMILFRMLQKTGEDVCFQCGEKIENLRDLSIEHKTPWLDSKDPVGLFFDLDNIAFSHLSCNCGAKRHWNQCYSTLEEKHLAQIRYQREWRERNPGLNSKRRRDKYLRNGT